MRFVTLLGALLTLTAPAAAISLEQYFFELSDRERGAYVTGFLDLFVRDSARDAEYRACVEQLGAGRLHQAVTELVKKDPRFLSYDAMSWLLYEASRLCNQKPPQQPSPPAAAEPAPAEAAAAPPAIADLPAASDAAAPALQPAETQPGGQPVLTLILVGIGGAVCGAVIAYAVARRRAATRPA